MTETILSFLPFLIASLTVTLIGLGIFAPIKFIKNNNRK